MPTWDGKRDETGHVKKLWEPLVDFTKTKVFNKFKREMSVKSIVGHWNECECEDRPPQVGTMSLETSWQTTGRLYIYILFISIQIANIVWK